MKNFAKLPVDPSVSLDKKPTVVILDEFNADLIGAPFKVTLCDAVERTIDYSTGRITTTIPNMEGLRKEIATARSLYPRRLNGQEVKFLRKCVQLSGKDLAGLLGITPEHLSRCENGDRALSPPAEKLLRVIIIRKRFDRQAIRSAIGKMAEELGVEHKTVLRAQHLLARLDDALDSVEQSVFEADISPVHDAEDRLEFCFHLAKEAEAGGLGDEDDGWERAA